MAGRITWLFEARY